MEKPNFEKIVASKKEEIIKSLQELLQIKSTYDESTIKKDMPFGEGINQALDYMLNKATKDGFKTLNDEGYAGEITYPAKDQDAKTVGILCHLDVVPEGNHWEYPPYEAKIVGDKLFARGAIDDKGPTMASYYALKLIKDAGIKLKKTIKIILGTDEETSWRGINHYLQKYPMPTIGFAPDCNFPLVYGEKGRMSFDLAYQNDFSKDPIISLLKGGERYNVVMDEVEAVLKVDLTQEFYHYLEVNHLKGHIDGNHYFLEGLAAHAMEPEKGINAGIHMCNFLKDYTNNPMIHFISDFFMDDPFFTKMGLAYNDYEMGPITVNIGIIDFNFQTTRFTLDIRFPVRYQLDHFKQVFQEKLTKYNLKITNETFKEPHYISPNDELVQKLYQAYVKNTGDLVNKPFTVGGGTYAGVLTKGVAYGMIFPGEVELAHQPNEYLSLPYFFKSILIYIDAILALGEIDA